MISEKAEGWKDGLFIQKNWKSYPVIHSTLEHVGI